MADSVLDKPVIVTGVKKNDESMRLKGSLLMGGLWGLNRVSYVLAVPGVIGAIAFHAPVAAQTVGFNSDYGRSPMFERRFDVAVSERPQPQFDAEPIRLGSYELLASSRISAGATNNVYATKTDEKKDIFGIISADLDVRSDWSRHEIHGIASADIIRYTKYSSENTELLSGGLSGIFEIGSRGTSLQGGGQFSTKAVSRLSTESTTTSPNLITYNESRAFVGATFGARQFHLSASADYTGQRYSSNGVRTALDEFRDRDVYQGTVKGEYAVSPSISTFILGRAYKRDFLSSSSTQPIRNSTGGNVQAGASFETGALLRAEVALGYMTESFESSAYKDVKGLTYTGKLEYFPTRLITVTATADRNIQSASRVGVGGFISNSYAVGADYELLRNLLISLYGGIGRDQYRGLDLSYDRNFLRFKTKYTMSRRIVIDLGLNYDDRNAKGTAIAREFSVLRTEAGLTFRF